jgi:EAL domain-containing protein (putative c-di-GMP-specific phosphodiesterase class I)
MEDEFGDLLALEQDLRLALQREEFSLHYQPEVSIDGNTIVGVEALLRWHSPTRGSVPPGRFIPIAESTGLILPLGEWVIKKACSQAARWRAEGNFPAPIVMWVNISGKQLSAGGLNVLIGKALAAANLPAECLGLEVTESAIVEGGVVGERARAELQELHDLGVKIAIDDFGTGFSSLGQLRSFPVDVIKVDRSFVQWVQDDAKDTAITAGLVNLAHSLGLVTIAEGIEHESQLQALRNLGCDQAQGFLFARPGPAEIVGRLLRQTTPLRAEPLDPLPPLRLPERADV